MLELFDTDSHSESYYYDSFSHRQQTAQERVTQFYAELVTLAEKAFPDMPAPGLDTIIKQQFLSGLWKRKNSRSIDA